MTRRRFAAASARGILIAASFSSMTAALADSPHSFSANIGAVSNYIWRGVTQTDDQPAIQGGLDYAHASGFSLGTWASNVDFATGANYELDVYAGYDFSLPVEDASLSLNTIYYAYPDDDFDIDFWEVGIAGGYKFFSAGIQYTVWGDEDNDGALFDDGDIYYYAALDFALPYDFGFKVHGGYYDFDNEDVIVDLDTLQTKSADYGHWGVSISKEAGDFGTFSFNYDQNDGKKELYDNDAKVWVGWNKEF